jgi:hypothetical protein
MFGKINFTAIILAIFAAVSVFAQTEEGFEVAASSNLTNISLPANAMRMSADKVPAEITQTLDKFIVAGEGKFQQGGSEVLVWTGSEYQKIGQKTTINRVMDSMKIAGWKYEEGGVENGVTIFTLLKDGKQRRGIMGFYGESDGILVLAWMEVFPNDGTAQNADPQVEKQVEPVPANNSGVSIVGTWDNGRVSTVNRQNTVTGAITPGSGTRFEYQFTANGKFYFTGLATTTNYSCTDTLFNEKAGSYTLNGSTLTLNPSKNFWRKTSTCGAGSERNYTLTKEVYQVSTKINEYNQELICLTNSSGEACYRRKQ